MGVQMQTPETGVSPMEAKCCNLRKSSEYNKCPGSFTKPAYKAGLFLII